MQLRRTRPARIAVAGTAALALAAALTSCGFDYATDRYYTPAAGTNDRDGVVDVLGAVVVSDQAGSGTFIASLSNNSSEDTISLTDVGSEDGTLTAGSFEPVELAPDGFVNLAQPAVGITLTGDAEELEAGRFVDLALTFDSGERTVMEVPVVPDSGDFDGLDTSGGDSATSSGTE